MQSTKSSKYTSFHDTARSLIWPMVNWMKLSKGVPRVRSLEEMTFARAREKQESSSWRLLRGLISAFIVLYVKRTYLRSKALPRIEIVKEIEELSQKWRVMMNLRSKKRKFWPQILMQIKGLFKWNKSQDPKNELITSQSASSNKFKRKLIDWVMRSICRLNLWEMSYTILQLIKTHSSRSLQGKL